MMRLVVVRSRSYLEQQPTLSLAALLTRRSVPYTATGRWFHPSWVMASPEETSSDITSNNNKKNIEEAATRLFQQKLAAHDFNLRRAAYKRQVSRLRKEFAEEVAQQRAADKAAQEALEKALTRQRLEHQRRKNLRSARNAQKQERLRLKRQEEFHEHLRVQQIKREQQQQRMTAARQLVIDRLEEEAPLWLSTREEVEAAFTPEAEQLLFARPGGVLGAPNPSLDAHYWHMETHTWYMDKTYKSMRQVLLERVEEMAYQQANVDESFWTTQRLEEQVLLEDKARLRAMVQLAGRAAVLRKQRAMLEEMNKPTDEDGIPKQEPVPSLKALRDESMLDYEGATILMDNPTKFFVFDNDEHSVISRGFEEESRLEAGGSSKYDGPSRGMPIRLRDPLRDGSLDNQVFPQLVGKYPKPDRRTEREKKQQEREKRMWAAAQLEQLENVSNIDLAAEQQTLQDLQPDIDYNEAEYDTDDEEWNKGLDPVADVDIINTPYDRRYSEGDIEWVSSQLQNKIKYLEQQCEQEIESLKFGMMQKAAEVDSSSTGNKGHADLRPLATEVDEDQLMSRLLSLSEKDLMAISDLDDQYKELTEADIEAAAEQIPSISKEELRFLLNRDRTV